MSNSSHRIIKEHYFRNMVKDALALTNGKSHYFIFIEADISQARQKLIKMKQNGEGNYSFTALLIFAFVKTIKQFPALNAMRINSKKIARYEAIDLFMPVEKKIDNEFFILPSIIRSAEELSLKEIAEKLDEIRDPNFEAVTKWETRFLKLPRFLRMLYLRYARRTPKTYKILFGSVLLSNVGMFNSNRMWPVGNPLRCVEIYIGNSFNDTDSSPENKSEKVSLDMVLAFDHSMVDGADGIRFIEYFKSLLEKSDFF